MRSRRDMVAEVPFGSGRLVIEQVTSEETNAFVDGHPDREERTRQLVYVVEGSRKLLGGLRDIVKMADVEGVAIAASVATCPADYATFLSAYESLGTVVRPNARFTYLQS